MAWRELTTTNLRAQTCEKGSSCRLSTRVVFFHYKITSLKTMPSPTVCPLIFSFPPLYFSPTTLTTRCPSTLLFAKLNPEPFWSGYFFGLIKYWIFQRQGGLARLELSCNEL
ncbi:hypothetical protein NC652_036885 [Populus alba x Populus x berolinensis]|nr:hypothetical protein NC652_036885 [Populus alba x Populus x berolinensis]